VAAMVATTVAIAMVNTNRLDSDISPPLMSAHPRTKSPQGGKTLSIFEASRALRVASTPF
jgi:hypothetical protein